MSSRDKYGKFRKKDYIYIIYAVRDYLCEKFGYKKKPFLFETRLEEGTLMLFIHRQNRYAIFYDYKQFKDLFGHKSFSFQNAYAGAIMAHEIRHYYQHRQMISLHPREKEEVIASWREDEWNLKNLGEGASQEEFYLQPLELDATLFEYVFGAEEFNWFLLETIAEEKHFNVMEQLYVEYFGETDETLFNDDIKERLRMRSERKSGSSY